MSLCHLGIHVTDKNALHLLLSRWLTFRFVRSRFATGFFRCEPGIDLVAMFRAYARRRSQVGEFHDHQSGDESFQAVEIEINGSLPGIGFGDHAHPVAIVLTVLTFRDYLHSKPPLLSGHEKDRLCMNKTQSG